MSQRGIDVILSRARREEIGRLTEEVRQNRLTLKIVSGAVLYLSKQELSFRGHDESSASLDKGNYRELLELIATLIHNLSVAFMEGWKIHREGLKGVELLLGFHLISRMILLNMQTQQFRMR